MLGKSRQSYYRRKWSAARNYRRSVEVVDIVRQVRQQLPRVGTRKLQVILQEPLADLGVGRDKLFSILRANNMIIRPRRSYRQTTNSHHRFHKHKDLVKDLVLSRAEQVWVSDITYIGGRDRSCYLALVTDAYSKKIVGYDLSRSLSADGCLRALSMAVRGRVYRDMELIHHSDRGIQYCCDQYQASLQVNKIRCSMTESYDPYSNAIAERVNGILKGEFALEREGLDFKSLSLLVEDSISRYNELRPHMSCWMLTPAAMHSQCSLGVRKWRTKWVESKISSQPI